MLLRCPGFGWVYFSMFASYNSMSGHGGDVLAVGLEYLEVFSILNDSMRGHGGEGWWLDFSNLITLLFLRFYEGEKKKKGERLMGWQCDSSLVSHFLLKALPEVTVTLLKISTSSTPPSQTSHNHSSRVCKVLLSSEKPKSWGRVRDFSIIMQSTMAISCSDHVVVITDLPEPS